MIFVSPVTTAFNDPTTRTALDLVTAALRKIGQYAPGETIDVNDAQDALDTLNGMLDQWSLQRFAVYNQVETVVTLTAGKAQYTIGTGGDFNITRPIALSQAYSRYNSNGNSVDFPCQPITLAEYSGIGLKNQPGPWPKVVYYNVGLPLGTLNFWPVPQQPIEFHLWSDAVFTSLNLTDTVNLPRGYFLGLEFNLAELLCSEYGMAVPPDVMRFAKEFRTQIKAANATPQAPAMIDPAASSSSTVNDAGWILHGGFR